MQGFQKFKDLKKGEKSILAGLLYIRLVNKEQIEREGHTVKHWLLKTLLPEEEHLKRRKRKGRDFSNGSFSERVEMWPLNLLRRNENTWTKLRGPYTARSFWHRIPEQEGLVWVWDPSFLMFSTCDKVIKTNKN